MIDCVTIATSHRFPGNLVAAQHRLRYQEVIAKEDWSNIYVADEMEFDRYDNVATEYFIARNSDGDVLGVARSYPTTIPYMLSDIFPFLASRELPSSHRVHEASRLVLDRSLLSKDARRPIVNELIVAYMERGLQRNIDAYVGFMLPRIWESTFLRAGWDVEWLGPEIALPGTTDIVRAAWMPVSKRMDDRVREATGIRKPVLNCGSESLAPTLVSYSHLRRDDKFAA
ncbi:MAG: acyl-homoserine-lactone synthase [Bryobacteraceae bacterium]|jgi:N-acyl-L-homoserine lactone synthetase